MIHVVIIEDFSGEGEQGTRLRVLGDHRSIGGIDYTEVGDFSLMKTLERLPREIERREERWASIPD